MIKKVYYKMDFLLMCFLIFFTITGCSLNHKNYYSDYDIVNNDSYSCQNCNINFSDDGRSIFCKIGSLEGHFEIANADLSNNCSVKIRFEGNIESGKAKLVLVKPDESVEILKEIISTENKIYSSDLLVACSSGINKIKFVGENYRGSFEISQSGNNLFNYTDSNLFSKDFLLDYKV